LNKQRNKILAATSSPPETGDYVWCGKDEDDRPLSKQEMREAIKSTGGRPKLMHPKKSTTIRLNAEVLDFFKSQGKGWQTRINDILQKHVNSHHQANSPSKL